MTGAASAVLSICLTCRDGREAGSNDLRGGAWLAQSVCDLAAKQGCAARLRGVRCLSKCKRACVLSLTAPGAFTYVFGDLDPECPAHAQAILDLIPLYLRAPEGFLTRDARPAPLRASILGRLPPIGTGSDLVSDLCGPTAQRVEA